MDIRLTRAGDQLAIPKGELALPVRSFAEKIEVRRFATVEGI